MKIAIAVVAALCAGFCFALGALIQQGAARQAHGRTLRFGLLVALAHERRWLAGIAVTVLAFGIQSVALGFGPLALVQPLVATEVLFALPMIAHKNRRPLTRKGIAGGLGVASGMASFVAVSPPAGGVSVPSLAAWAPALAGITALAALSGFAALQSHGIGRVIWLAAATAVIYALVNALTKSSVGLLTLRGAGVLATWEPYTLMTAGILSALFGQSAFNTGPLSLSLPVIDTVEPVSSIILAAAVFGEHLARSPGLLALQFAGGAIAVAGIAVLSHSPVVLAEQRREVRPTARQGGPAPHTEAADAGKVGWQETAVGVAADAPGWPGRDRRDGDCTDAADNGVAGCSAALSRRGAWADRRDHVGPAECPIPRSDHRHDAAGPVRPLQQAACGRASRTRPPGNGKRWTWPRLSALVPSSQWMRPHVAATRDLRLRAGASSGCARR
jgi:hypothetical protein